MNRDSIVETRPAFDYGAAVGEAKRLLGEIERLEERRLRLGQHLKATKKAIGHGKWLPFLRDVGVDDETARRYMQLAGWVEQKPQSEEFDIPTYAEAGIVPRAPRAQFELENRPNGRSELVNRDENVRAASEIIDAPEDDLSDVAAISDGIRRHTRSLFNLAQRLAGAQANKAGVLVSVTALNGLKVEVLSARAELNDFCRLMGWTK